MVNHPLFPLLLVWFFGAYILKSSAITDPSDVHALIQVKLAVDPSTIREGSCMATWNFSVDPCDNLFGMYFSCGIACSRDRNGAQRVTRLKLDGSGYSGTLSPAVGNLSSLQQLQIEGNTFSGSVPSSIGQLHQLVILDLSENLFTGRLPSSIFEGLRTLQILNINGNLLSGTLPITVSSIVNLVKCRLQNNQFTGYLPDLSSLKQLRLLDLSGNRFYGSLPLKFPPSLFSASFRNNLLRGGFTKQHVRALNPALVVLDVSTNRLSGPVDASLFQHPSLQQLILANNSFTMLINELSGEDMHMEKSQMVAIDMSNNRIGGLLPRMFAVMPNLSSLSLSNNAFYGQINVSYAIKALSERAGMQPLQRMMLNGNYLTGPLPSLFMKLSPENTMASLVDNCLPSCPSRLFFCQGADQKPISLCRLYNVNV
ncbi:hypothetical protein KP509_02G055000 [Ceratopteris richardii]|uniref:Leucine-rich repeat-containing N-terminal plant-type domain-containing protein n=1 Tax=Ceratopteris richardii TaxID=49495 RepID=A0A8T2VD54_CERRI|nr:hypothetical protein KP509_02G055000 [Ceratopteris richardii]